MTVGRLYTGAGRRVIPPYLPQAPSVKMPSSTTDTVDKLAKNTITTGMLGIKMQISLQSGKTKNSKFQIPTWTIQNAHSDMSQTEGRPSWYHDFGFYF